MTFVMGPFCWDVSGENCLDVPFWWDLFGGTSLVEPFWWNIFGGIFLVFVTLKSSYDLRWYV